MHCTHVYVRPRHACVTLAEPIVKPARRSRPRGAGGSHLRPKAAQSLEESLNSLSFLSRHNLSRIDFSDGQQDVLGKPAAQFSGRSSLMDFTDAVGISDSLLGRVTTPANNVHFVNIDDLGFGPRGLSLSPDTTGYACTLCRP